MFIRLALSQTNRTNHSDRALVYIVVEELIS